MNSKTKRKTFPKEGEKKLKDTIQTLRSRNRYLEKKIKWYEQELVHKTECSLKFGIYNVAVPEPEKRTEEIRMTWKKEFLKKFRESLKGNEPENV